MPLLLFFFFVLNDSIVFHDVSDEAGLRAAHRALWKEGARVIEPQYLAAGTAWADYDNDGWVDLFITGNLDPNVLYRNDGGIFSVSEHSSMLSLPDIPSGGAVWADYDNDGWLDLFLAATGMAPEYGPVGMQADYPDMLYHNEGDGSFSAVAPWRFSEGTHPTMGFSAADYDRDGRVDFALTYWNGGHRLFRNTDAAALGRNWIAFDARGGNGLDADAIGARARVDADDGLSQLREVKSGAGSEMTLHFGLGKAGIERVLVNWLNGEYHEYSHVAVNQRCLITPAGMECENQPSR